MDVIYLCGLFIACVVSVRVCVWFVWNWFVSVCV